MATKKETENLENAVLNMDDPKVQEILAYLSEQAKLKEQETDPDAERHARLQKSEELRAQLPQSLTIFRDGDKYKDDVCVGYNGKNYLIQRGKRVTVPKAVAEIYFRSELQRARANEYSKDLQSAFEEKSKDV